MGVFDNVLSEILDETRKGMQKAAETLLEDANYVVPVKTGELKESGHIEISQDTVAVVYDTDYALQVHENPEGRGYKWLERTADINENKYVEIIAGGGK